MRHYYSITDFRKNPRYLHKKLCEKENNIHNLLLTCLGEGSHYYFLEDDVIINVKGSTYIDNNTVGTLRVFDGIYDIWLRNCKNVRFITIELDGIGIVYNKTFDDGQSNDIQIPLAFESTGKPVEYMFYEEKGLLNTYVSFIPANGLIFNKMRIVLNEDAEVTVNLSTVYMHINCRRQMVHCPVHFYINGNIYLYYYPKFMHVKTEKEPNTICNWLFGFGKHKNNEKSD